MQKKKSLFQHKYNHDNYCMCRIIRCDHAGENGVTRLAHVRCPVGLAFDVFRQTCDWKSNVKNCDQLGSKLLKNGRYELPPYPYIDNNNF